MGLEKARRCGFIPAESRGPEKAVWVRAGVVSQECPKSYVTPQSIAIVERFFSRKQFGGVAAEELNARDADGFVVLEKEWQREQ